VSALVLTLGALLATLTGFLTALLLTTLTGLLLITLLLTALTGLLLMLARLRLTTASRLTTLLAILALLISIFALVHSNFLIAAEYTAYTNVGCAVLFRRYSAAWACSFTPPSARFVSVSFVFFSSDNVASKSLTACFSSNSDAQVLRVPYRDIL
jgi:hypothetical protein